MPDKLIDAQRASQQSPFNMPDLYRRNSEGILVPLMMCFEPSFCAQRRQMFVAKFGFENHELEAFELKAGGHTYSEIGCIIRRKPDTAKRYLKKVREKLNVATTEQACSVFGSYGVVPLKDIRCRRYR